MTIVVNWGNNHPESLTVNKNIRKFDKFLKLFRRMSRRDDDFSMRSRKRSDITVNPDSNLFKIRDMEKFYGKVITDTVNKKPNR